MAVTTRFAGTASLKIGGTVYPVRGKLSYMPLNETSESDVGQDGHRMIKKKRVAPYVEVDFSDLGNSTVTALQSVPDPLSLELANGKTVILTGTTLEGELKVDTEQGSFSAKFTGDNCQELVAQS